MVYLHREKERIISLDTYSEMKQRCLKLEEQVKNLSGGEERVVVEEAQIKILESEIEHVRKNLKSSGRRKRVRGSGRKENPP